MGAGAPKLRMRLTMPPVKKNDWMPGKPSRRAARSLSTICTSLMSRCSLGSRFICRLPTCGPVLLVNSAVRPPGSPRSEIMVVYSDPLPVFSPAFAPMAPFITPSSRCATCSVRSTRVPMGVLNVSVNWLSSEDGKNSLPILKYSGIVEAHSPTITSTVASRCRSSTRSSRAYAWSMRSSPRAMLPIRPRRVSRSCAGGFSQYMHKSGVTVRETKKLIISAKLIVIASGINKLRATPDRNSTGKNTTMVVMVDTKIGIATSCAASSTAVLRDFCSPRWRWMFSSSTMLSSTSRPTPSASPPSVNTFSVCPAK